MSLLPTRGTLAPTQTALESPAQLAAMACLVLPHARGLLLQRQAVDWQRLARRVREHLHRAKRARQNQRLARRAQQHLLEYLQPLLAKGAAQAPSAQESQGLHLLPCTQHAPSATANAVAAECM